MTIPNIPHPSPEQVILYLKKREELKRDVVQSRALEILFTQTYPRNTDIHQVLIKASALNDFYNTRIFNIWRVAEHIRDLDIDERLLSGDMSLVDDLANVNLGNNIHKRFYSFATKYCSFHQPELFSIYDRFVEKMLLHFRRIDKFYTFNAPDLRDYPKFRAILDAFQEYYGLTRFSKRELDHYLWLVGSEHFQNDTQLFAKKERATSIPRS